MAVGFAFVFSNIKMCQPIARHYGERYGGRGAGPIDGGRIGSVGRGNSNTFSN